jgi:hypothetical protein
MAHQTVTLGCTVAVVEFPDARPVLEMLFVVCATLLSANRHFEWICVDDFSDCEEARGNHN